MNDLDEKEIRDRLQRAVAPLDPVAPPLAVLRERAVRLRRFRVSAAGGLLAAAAAAAVVAAVVVPASGSGSTKVAAAPSRSSLTSYASAHGGKHVAGPVADGSHYVGAFATKRAVVVVRYRGGVWRTDGKPVTAYGPGRLVLRLSDGGDVVPGRASFALRLVGGDVSYFGGVLYDDAGTWAAARFARCGKKDLSCRYAGTSQPYGHVANGRFVSVHNDCTPYCAAGTDFHVVWRWDSATHRFKAVQMWSVK